MNTVLWCRCGARCGGATRDGKYARIVPRTRPGRRRTQPVKLLDLTDRSTPPIEWACTTCGNTVRLAYPQLQRVGNTRKLVCDSMPTE